MLDLLFIYTLCAREGFEPISKPYFLIVYLYTISFNCIHTPIEMSFDVVRVAT